MSATKQSEGKFDKYITKVILLVPSTSLLKVNYKDNFISVPTENVRKTPVLRSSERLLYVPVSCGRGSFKTQKSTLEICVLQTTVTPVCIFLIFQIFTSPEYRNVHKTFRRPESRVFLTFSGGIELKFPL